ncbi:hypothetical protein PybrP1_008981 [[Pythium] brassicae (nom. inval.)]|nr:hypothetical protein PybrP1_008981 [[Pythium] brassicae (nom. inval.)]
MHAAHLDLAFCSSEDESCPATNLQTWCSSVATASAANHAATTELEFCEYPQELVFRVNRGIPTPLDSLHILAHHTKIPTRIEVFTSSSPAAATAHRDDTREPAEFRRLGYVTLQSNEATGFSVRELKIVHLQRRERVTLVRLVLHRCHTNNKHNLFQQVGLLSVIACEAPAALPSPQRRVVELSRNSASWRTRGFLPPLQLVPSVGLENDGDSTTEPTDHLFSTSLSLLRANAAYEVWVPELRAFTTPLEIYERIQAGYGGAAQSGDAALAQRWRAIRLECRHLLSKLNTLQRTFDVTNRLLANDEDRAAMFEEIELVVQDFGALGSKAFGRGLSLPYERWTPVESDLKQTAGRQLNKTKSNSTRSTRASDVKSHQLLTPAVGKNDLEGILDALLVRLGDRQAVIRNNAAFSILKVAELTRPGGTFVMHLLLKRLEGKQVGVTDQVLYALLKLFSALLLAFHCCASIDIAPKRVLRFLARCDGDLHASPHIRDATKQLTLAMYHEVGASVMQRYLDRLPAEIQEMYQRQFKIDDERKPDTGIPETATAKSADASSTRVDQ